MYPIYLANYSKRLVVFSPFYRCENWSTNVFVNIQEQLLITFTSDSHQDKVLLTEWNAYNEGYKKEATSRWAGPAPKSDSWASRRISQPQRSPQSSKGPQHHTRTLQPRVPVPGGGVPTKSGYKNQWRMRPSGRDIGNPDVPLKSPHTDSLTYKH